MSVTEPIRDIKNILRLKEYFMYTNPNPRNYALVVFGLNSALRIGDMLSLRWRDICDDGRGKRYICLTEQKTGKDRIVLLNAKVIDALRKLYRSCEAPRGYDYIFYGKNGPGEHLSRSQAYRIIKAAADNLGIDGHIACHSLRKTFGYQAWKNGIDPILIMEIYNHSSFAITRRYLCIDQDEKNNVYLEVNL